MEKKEKEPFERIRKEKLEEYKAQLSIMKNFFLLGYDYDNNRSINEYNLFISNELIKNMKKGIQADKIKKISKKNWENNFDNINAKYKNIKESIINFISKIEEIQKNKGFDIFYEQEKLKDKNKTLNYLKKQWKKLPFNIKTKY